MRPKMFVPLHPKAGVFAEKSFGPKIWKQGEEADAAGCTADCAPSNALTTLEQQSSQDELSN